MKTCGRCKDRYACARICEAVESTLPKDESGKDSHREINMPPEHLAAAAEKGSYVLWQ